MNISFGVPFGVPCNKLLIIGLQFFFKVTFFYYDKYLFFKSCFVPILLHSDVLEGGMLKVYGHILFYSTQNLQWTCTKKRTIE